MKRIRNAPSRILVIDVGGSHVKCVATGHETPVRFDSGPTMTPDTMIQTLLLLIEGWRYDAVSIGYPGVVRGGKIDREPQNLGAGWIGFDFEKAIGCPVTLLNDAAMQALGNYDGGSMLFLGLGTGLGTTLIVDRTIVPMELAHLPYRGRHTYEELVGDAARKRQGKKKWSTNVERMVKDLRDALLPDEIVLGGGNARKLKTLPAHTRIGANTNAFEGGFRIWAER
jgi:predicted NBD/HSP70 family sugar kinase